MKKVRLNISVKEETKEKLRCIAKKEMRTASGQADYLLRQFIKEYENEHGKIEISNY